MKARVYGGPLSGRWILSKQLSERLEAPVEPRIPVDTPPTDSIVIRVVAYDLRKFADGDDTFWVYTLPGRDPCFLCEGDREARCPQCWGDGDMPKEEAP